MTIFNYQMNRANHSMRDYRMDFICCVHYGSVG